MFLVAAAAIGPEQCLVPAGTTDALDTLGTAVREVWVVGGVGRVLPARIYDVMREATFAASEEFSDDPLPVEELAIVGSMHRGTARRAARGEAAARSDCPVVPELFRPLDCRAKRRVRRR